MPKNQYNELMNRLNNKKDIVNLDMQNDDVKKILQELDIYHAELIAQNEELIEKEEKLIASNKEYELLFYDAPVAYLVIDKSFHIKKYNKRANEYFGLSFSLLDTIMLFSYINISYLEKILTWISKEEFLNEALELEMKFARSQLKRFKVYGNYYPSNENTIILSFIDINEEYILKNDLKTQVDLKTDENLKQYHILQQQSKFAAMGEMIANIAHQWRQPLNVLSAHNLDISLKYKNNKLNDDVMNNFYNKTKTVVEKMSETIESFVDFFNPNKEKAHFKLIEVIDEVFNLLDNSFEKNQINIIVNCDEGISFKAYKSEFEQILLIILNNSRDSIIANNIEGKISINIEKISNKYLQIEIIDNAGGVNEKIIDRIFEPYFTTKSKNLGTGIGLYMSKMIVEESLNGTIALENFKDGVKTTISLPYN